MLIRNLAASSPALCFSNLNYFVALLFLNCWSCKIIVKLTATTTLLLLSLMLTCRAKTTVAAPPADTPPNKSMEEFRNHLRSTLTNYLITQTGARWVHLSSSKFQCCFSLFKKNALRNKTDSASVWLHSVLPRIPVPTFKIQPSGTSLTAESAWPAAGVTAVAW